MTEKHHPSGYDPTVLDDETGLPLWMGTIPAVQRLVEIDDVGSAEGDVIPFPRKPAVRRAYVDPRQERWVDAVPRRNSPQIDVARTTADPTKVKYTPHSMLNRAMLGAWVTTKETTPA